MTRRGSLVGILKQSLGSRQSSVSSNALADLDELEASSARKFKGWVLKVVDITAAFTVLPLAVTILWRAIWQLLDQTLTTIPNGANIDNYPDQKWNSIWKSLPICLILSFILNASQFHISKLLKKYFRDEKSFRLWIILRISIFFSLFLGVASWRGFWDLWDLMLYKLTFATELKFQLAIIIFILVNSYVLMSWPLQVTRSLISSPLQVSKDGRIEDIFESPTLFNKKPPSFDRNEFLGFSITAWNWYFFDVFASTFIVQFLSITAWWGLWTLEDKIIGVASTSDIFFWYILVGYSCSLTAYAIQFTIAKPVTNLRQKFWSETICAVGFIGVISFWKGIWDYSDVILAPLLGIEDRRINLAVQIFLAYLVLLVFNQTSLASNRGVVLNSPESEEQRNENLFELDNLALCCQKNDDDFILTIDDEISPLLE